MNKMDVNATPFVFDSSGSQQSHSFGSSGITKKLGNAIVESQFQLIAQFGFGTKQIVQLQRINLHLYRQVADWVYSVKTYPDFRLSEVFAFDKDSTETFEFPTKDMIYKQRQGLQPLVGFQTEDEAGLDIIKGFILSNGQQSYSYPGEESKTKYDSYFIPADVLQKIRSVETEVEKNSLSLFTNLIPTNALTNVISFSFFDKDGALLWEIGYTNPWRKETVMLELEDNEVIFGVTYTLCRYNPKLFCNFQFKIAKLEPSLKLDEYKFTARSRFLANETSWSQCFRYIFQFGFNRAQMVQLQGVCKIFYTRVAEWMKIMTVYRHIKIRRSEVALFSHKKDLEVIEFPTETMVDDWCGIPPILVGFQIDQNERGNVSHNVILSNEKKKKQRHEDFKTSQTYMLPYNAHKKIRSVCIHYSDCIDGFDFYDKKGKSLCKIGNNYTKRDYIVQLYENEIIVGAVFKYDQSSKVNTNWQFKIAKLESPLNLENIDAVGEMEKQLEKLCKTGKFKNQFQYINGLGKGKFWKILLATKIKDGKDYAVKRVTFNQQKTSDLYSDIKGIILQQRREVEALANLPAHPNITRYIAHWLEEMDLSELKEERQLDQANEFQMNTMPNFEANFNTVYSFNLYIQMETEYPQKKKVQKSLLQFFSTARPTTPENSVTIVKPVITLEEFIEGQQKPDRNQNYDIMSQLVNGFETIHGNGIVHRDLKPSNIFYKDGVCKIANFSFSEKDKTSSSPGSKKYIAPELESMTDQERANLSLESQKKIDIHALGVILSDLIGNPTAIMEEEKIDTTNKDTKTQLSQGQEPEELIERKLILRLVDPDPDQRPKIEDIIQVWLPLWEEQLNQIQTLNDADFSFPKTVNNLPPVIPIAFLYADALVCKNNWENNDMMAIEKRDSDDLIYDEIVKLLASNNNDFQILHEPLNRQNLTKVSIIKAKILFLDCHGYTNNQSGFQFCFEQVDNTGHLEQFSEQTLIKILKDNECQVQLVVLSACPSNSLGQLLIAAGIKVVVSSNTLIRETQVFNNQFLIHILEGKTPEEALKLSISPDKKFGKFKILGEPQDQQTPLFKRLDDLYAQYTWMNYSADISIIQNQPDPLEDSIDIAFMYADVLVNYKKGEYLTYQALSPEKMYSQILEELKKKNTKTFKTIKKPLNRRNFMDVIQQNPKILFIYCHGDFDQDPETKSGDIQIQSKQLTHFSFESEAECGLEDSLTEQNLVDLLKESKCQIELVVLSSCHSQKLGQIMVDAGIPVVVGINTFYSVLEIAANAFNRMLLCSLLNGWSVKYSFNQGINFVRSSEQYDCKSCCCCHPHTEQCLWLKYLKKHGQDKAHQLHTWNCKCHKIKDKYTDAKINYIEHEFDCTYRDQFKNFYNSLLNEGAENKTEEQKELREQIIQANQDLIEKKEDDPSFLKAPMMRKVQGKKEKWCCCRSDLFHDESNKFVPISGKILADLDYQITLGRRRKNKTDKQIIQSLMSPKELPGWLMDPNLLIDRKQEQFSLVKFLETKTKRLIQVYGKDQNGQKLGRKLVVTNAVRYFLERRYDDFISGAFLVDLKEARSLQEIVAKFSEEFNRKFTDSDDLIREIDQRKMLFVVTGLPFPLSGQDTHGVQDLFTEMIQKNSNLKLILVTDEVHTKFDWHHCLQIKPISNSTKFKLYESEMMKTKEKSSLIGKQDAKHQIFGLVCISQIRSQIVEKLSASVRLDHLHNQMLVAQKLK